MKPHKTQFFLACGCMLFSAIFDSVSLGMIVPLADKVLTNKKIILPNKVPAFIENFITSVNAIEPLALLKIMAIGILTLFIIKGFFNYWQSYLMSNVGQKVIRDIRARLYDKLQILSLDYFTKKRSGELISRITHDVKLVENATSYALTDLIYQTFQVIIFTSLVFIIHWRLALIAFVVGPLIMMPIVNVGKKLRKLSKTTQEKMADINSILQETIFGVKIVKSFAMEDYEAERFNRQNQDYYKVTMKSIKRTLVLAPVTEIIGAFVGIFVFWLAGKEVITGKLSFGVFGLFLGSLLSMIRPFKKLSQVNSIIQQALAANTRIYEILEAPVSVEEKLEARELPRIKKNIIFEGVCFRYHDTEILKDVNLEVKQGEIVAIVGPSGVGKSTLVDLIPRFYDPQKGKILIDGIDIKEVSLKSLRKQIGIVTQETILFNDTITANIDYGNKDANLIDIEEVAKQAYAHDFILGLRDGYNTVIGDRGLRLSGGEKQRIAIARALLKNPPILILDEATSQLDTESERLVQQALDKLMQGRTVFVVAHRLSTIRHATKILVLNEGRIVETGSHDELLSKQGLYKKLYELQNF